MSGFESFTLAQAGQTGMAVEQYRRDHGLTSDAPIECVLSDDGMTVYLFQPGTFLRLEGGTLDIGIWKFGRRSLRGWVGYKARRARYHARRMWGWTLYGWRWWE